MHGYADVREVIQRATTRSVGLMIWGMKGRTVEHDCPQWQKKRKGIQRIRQGWSDSSQGIQLSGEGIQAPGRGIQASEKGIQGVFRGIRISVRVFKDLAM